MLLRGYLPGMMEFTRPGTGSNHIMPLFMTTPVPFGTMPEPKPAIRVLVMDTALPSASMAQRCVVPESSAGALASNTRDGAPSSNAHGSPGAISPSESGEIPARRLSVYPSDTMPFQGTSTKAGSAMYLNLSA